MRWKMMVRDGTRDGTSYGSDEQREGHASGRDQAVARMAAGTRRSFRAWTRGGLAALAWAETISYGPSRTPGASAMTLLGSENQDPAGL